MRHLPAVSRDFLHLETVTAKELIFVSIDRVREYLKDYGVADRIREFPVSSATVELAAAAIGCAPGRIAKTLSFLLGSDAVLVVAAGDARIDNAKYKAQFGAKAKMLTPEQVEVLKTYDFPGNVRELFNLLERASVLDEQDFSRLLAEHKQMTASLAPAAAAELPDELDAATIYATIENEIAPAFYNINKETGRSSEWIEFIKNTVAQVACNFTTNRMLSDYISQYYEPQSVRTASIVADDYKVAREIAAWKKHLRREWQNVGVISMVKPDSSHEDIALGKEFMAEVVLSIGDLQPEDVGVEMLFAASDNKGKLHIQESFEFKPVENSDGVVKYQASLLPQTTGMYQVAARIYAKNPLLPHRQDFELVRWL